MDQLNIDKQLELIWEIRYKKTSEALQISNKTLEDSKAIDYKKGIAYSLLYKNLFSFWLIKEAEVLEPIFEALKLFKELNDKLGLTRAYNILGSIYDNYGDYNSAIEYSQLAIKFAKEIDLTEELGDAYTTLGQIYNRIEDYNAAIELLKKGLEFREKSKANFAMSSSLNLIARTYTLNKEYEKALEYYNKSLTLRKSIKDTNGLPWSFLGIASLYQEMQQNKNAINYYDLALANKNENKRLELLCFIGLGKIQLKEGDLEKSYSFLSQALNSAEELKMKSLIYEVHFLLSTLYHKQNNSIKELEHFKAFYTIKEQVINAETTNQLKKQQVAFSIERSQKEAEIYQLKNVELKKAYNIVKEKNIEITDSINYAKRIQDALFPTLANFYSTFPNSFLIYKPKDIVAGDFYWMEIIGSKIFFAVADCTGHGVPGAMVSVICNNALNRSVREFNLSKPSKILDKVTNLVRLTFEKSEEIVLDGMDITLCSFDTETKVLEYSGANNSLYVITNDDENYESYIDHKTIKNEKSSLITIPATKQPIGGFDYLKPFTNHKIQLKKGDFICLFSDGYADQFGGLKGKKFKYVPFKKLLLSAHSMAFNKQQPFIEKTFNNWMGELEQVDDVCVMGINIQ
jgi:serine phosphatase RsbU (regulator of sigma subunit)